MKALKPDGIQAVWDEITQQLEFIRIQDPNKTAEKMQAVAWSLRRVRRVMRRECQIRESFEP